MFSPTGAHRIRRFAGQQALGLFEFRTDRKWIWYGILYMLAMQVVLTCLTIFALRYARPDVRLPSVPDQEALDAYRKVRHDT